MVDGWLSRKRVPQYSHRAKYVAEVDNNHHSDESAFPAGRSSDLVQ